jgi:hypothetical protein
MLRPHRAAVGAAGWGACAPQEDTRGTPNCAYTGINPPAEGAVSEHAEVKRVQVRNQAMLLAMPNVIGLGIGLKTVHGRRSDQLCLAALVRRKLPRAALEAEELVPDEIDGIPTDVLEVGDVRAETTRTTRQRPAPGGVSLGHVRVTAGTFGCIVRDRASGDALLLSNNHVVADSNQGQPGDAILQPGAADGGREPADVIAALERFGEIQFSRQPSTCSLASGLVRVVNRLAAWGGFHHRLEAWREDPLAVNRIDAAVARPYDENDVLAEVLELGPLSGTRPPELGLKVRKSGRSTGLTTGEISVLEATITVGYGDRTAQFAGQIVTTPMSSPGDSGSVLVENGGPRAVGLLFAGSDQATLYNPIDDVLRALAVEL